MKKLLQYGKCGRNLEIALKRNEYKRGSFECTALIERLCEYEDIGLTPKEIQVLAAKRGEWELVSPCCIGIYQCTECGLQTNYTSAKEWIYCPNCGAKMDGYV